MERLQTKQIKAVLLDWDDTQVDTFHRVIRSLQNFAEHHQLVIPTAERVLKFWGRTSPAIITALWPEQDSVHLTSWYREFTKLAELDTPPFAGTAQTLQKLNDQGLCLGIVSSNTSERIETLLARHMPEIRPLYRIILGADECPAHKPDPRVFDPAFAYLNKLGIDEFDTIYVGDSVSDLLAARSRGLPFVAVLTGTARKAEFLQAGLESRQILSDLTRLPAYLAETT
ncbi:HAD family hydrolase [Patescibacteria group bacterium]|nr:HAD family hydrolase [Patescibacteria group bacterium]MCL5409815.1 HAD family hydrolase [Patescibacteria group bacterium]